MVNIITSKSRNSWRVNRNSKYRGASRAEVEERGREVYAETGDQKAAENAVRELTMYDDPKKCWENFGAGVAAIHDEQEKRALPTEVVETPVTIKETK